VEEEKRNREPRFGTVNLERRKYPRVTLDLPIEYYRIDSSSRQTGRAENAGEGGLLLYLTDRMAIGQELKIKLFFSSGVELNTIEMVGEVAWTDIHLDQGWGDYRAGIRFIDISPENLDKLKNFLQSLIK
jgi:c-di-GMP-binding flagellar brake protein YcgR